MSLWGMYLKKEGEQPSRREVDDCLSGNLCRCTGYRPIIDAAYRMGELPRVDFDETALAASLAPLQHTAMTTYSKDGQNFYAPRSLEELVLIRSAKPQATMLAGSTDIGLWVTKQMRQLGDIIYLGHVDALKQIEAADGLLHIGAGVSLNDAYAALCEHYPELSEMWQRFASMPIRNAGTLGGNVANGSPIGDSMPWMIALGSSVVLRGPMGERVLPLDAFYLDYQKKDLRADEFVQSVSIALPKAGRQFRTYKLAKRFDQDISAVCAAFCVTLDGGRVSEARIAFGGMAAIPKRATQTEALLHGREWNEQTLGEAMAMLANDYAPLTDMRASNTYRMKAAQNLLRRFWLETRVDAPLAANEVNAFAVRA
jgi:xanthine dehydrogenase small subunit